MPRQRRRTSASGQVQSSSPFASDLHTTSFFCNYRWFPPTFSKFYVGTCHFAAVAAKPGLSIR